jgi:tripartite-type tricarboxylate transporter receptor subunit TctC
MVPARTHCNRHHLRAGLGSLSLLALTLLATTPTPVSAQDYPTRTVKVIVPHPAGGTADTMPRVFADWLSRKWKQPVVIENRPGAAGNIGAEQAFRAEPDGYTLKAAAPSPLVINQNLYPKMNFDPTKFEPIMVMGEVPNALIANPNFPPNSIQEVIAYAKAHPGRIICATQGMGSTSHLTSGLFQLLAHVSLQDVHYRGSAPAMNDVLGGTAQIMFNNLGVSRTLVAAGKVKLLGVATAKRMPSLPDVPAIAEVLPGFVSAGWFAYVAPPKTPQSIVNKINADLNEALRQPEIIARMKAFSAEIVGGTPEDTAKYMREEVERWGKVIKAANIKL